MKRQIIDKRLLVEGDPGYEEGAQKFELTLQLGAPETKTIIMSVRDIDSKISAAQERRTAAISALDTEIQELRDLKTGLLGP